MIQLVLCLVVAGVAGVLTANYQQFGWDLKTIFYMHQYGFMLAFTVVVGVAVKALFFDARKMGERSEARASTRLKEQGAKLEKEYRRKLAEIEKIRTSNKQQQRGLTDLEVKTRKLYEIQLRDTDELETRKAAMFEAEQLFTQMRDKIQKKNLPLSAIENHLSRLDKKEAKFRELIEKAGSSKGVAQ